MPPPQSPPDAVKHFMYIGVGFGWQRRCKTCQSLRELDNQGTVFFFLAVAVLVVELDHVVPSGEHQLLTRGMIASRSVNMIRQPRGSYYTHCCLWSGHTKKQSNSLALSSINKKVGTRCRSPSYERFLKGCSSPFMRLAEHLTALRAWCKQYLPGW